MKLCPQKQCHKIAKPLKERFLVWEINHFFTSSTFLSQLLTTLPRVSLQQDVCVCVCDIYSGAHKDIVVVYELQLHRSGQH